MKKVRRIILIIILMIVVGTITFFIGRQIGLNTDTSSTTTTVTQETVSTHTITNTLTSSGEVETALTENLTLDTSKYFSTMCVEEDDSVSEGENILEYTDGTYLVAPYDCVVSAYTVPDASSICTSSNYITIESLEDLQTSLSISESEILEVSEGQSVEITLSADESITYEGVISHLDSVGTYSSSGATFSATVTFTNDGNAKIGMSLSATITIEEVEDVIAVPIEAVTTEDDVNYVELVNTETEETEKVEVELGIADADYVEILSGLSEGDIIQITVTTTESDVSSDDSESEMSMMGGGRGASQGDFGGMPDSASGGGEMSMPSGDFGGGRGN